jgi:hypothetical protein
MFIEYVPAVRLAITNGVRPLYVPLSWTEALDGLLVA